MKRCKWLLIPGVVLAAVSGVMLANLDNVEAENNTSICKPEYFKEKYLDKLDISINGNVATISNAAGLSYGYTNNTTGEEVRGNVDANGTFTITISDFGSENIHLYLTQADSCGAAAGEEVGSITVNSGSFKNSMYDNELCVNYRNKYSNNTTMKNAVSYCFEEEVSVQYSYDQVKSWVDLAESYYATITSIKDDNQASNDQEGYYEDVKNTGTLTCDAFSTDNYGTIHKFNHVETTTENNCVTTCEEHVEINFSDPVATQAGMCFQYLIEIKSVVECDANYVAPPPTRPTVCTPYPICSESNGWSGDAGGPSEEFDACISECDGGKYTQSCIDSCYNKVYGSDEATSEQVKADNSTTTLFSKLPSMFTIDAELMQVANDSCINPSSVNYYDDSQIMALYNFRQSNPGGYYSGGRWVPSGTCPSSLAPYYFQSFAMTKRTVGMLKGIVLPYGNSTAYYYASGGLLMAVYRNGVNCNDNCYWVNNCSSDSVLTAGQAEEQYQEALKEYEAAKQACEGKSATCSNETTEYKIVVDNLDGNDSKDDDDKSDWQEEFSSEQKMNSSNVTGDFPSMVTLVDGECEDGEDDPWHYHNIITFPGTWINNKTGQTVHSIQPGHEDFYTNIGNEFCTKLNSVPVNTAWYEWKVNQDGKELTDAEKQEINSNIEMNIRGSIDNYGYFGWNFDIECFYALIKDPGDCVGDTCKQSDNNGGNGDDGESPTTDYTFRSISLDNLFPSSEAGETSREAGFNWTCEATNLENPDYPVQPVALKEEIERLGDSIYDNEAYLDYRIVLTPESMNKIRDYNKSVGSYSEPTGSSKEGDEILSASSDEKTSGITVYKSYLLHKVLNSNELLKEGLIGCNNEYNGQCDNAIVDNSCYREYQAASQVLKGGS